MAIVFLKLPPQVSAAFNPIMLVVQTPKARYAQLKKDLAAATDETQRAKIVAEMNALEPNREQDTLDPIYIATYSGLSGRGKPAVISREPDSEGKAEIDLSYIVRYAFTNIQTSQYPNAIADYNLQARYAFTDTPEENSWVSRYAINAARQMGESLHYPPFSLTTQTHHVHYAGYPTSLSFLFCEGAMRYYRLSKSGRTHTGAVFNTITDIYVSDAWSSFDDLTIFRDSAFADAFATYHLDEGCVPDLPFYVRWINTRGGWDYHMFERREETSEVGDFSIIQRAAIDWNDTQTTVSASAAKTVTVGAGLLDRGQYDVLSALPRSPRIEWYNEEIKAWQVIVISEDFSSVWNSRNAFGSTEFTFLMPRILTQF